MDELLEQFEKVGTHCAEDAMDVLNDLIMQCQGTLSTGRYIPETWKRVVEMNTYYNQELALELHYYIENDASEEQLQFVTRVSKAMNVCLNEIQKTTSNVNDQLNMIRLSLQLYNTIHYGIEEQNLQLGMKPK